MARHYADEYLIYAFSEYKPHIFGVNNWRFIAKNNNPNQSLEHAQKLYTSNKFDRIEVKRKSFDSKKNQYSLSTYEVLGKKHKMNAYKILMAALLIFAALSYIAL